MFVCTDLTHVSRAVNPFLRIFWHLGIESLLYLTQYLLVLLRCHKTDTQPLGPKSASTTNTVQVRVGIDRQVVVDGQVDALDINTSAKDVSCNADALAEFFELFEAFNTGSEVSRSWVDWDK